MSSTDYILIFEPLDKPVFIQNTCINGVTPGPSDTVYITRYIHSQIGLGSIPARDLKTGSNSKTPSLTSDSGTPPARLGRTTLYHMTCTFGAEGRAH